MFSAPSRDKLRHEVLAVLVGNSVRLNCSTDVYPRPTATWYKDGKFFKKRKNGKKIYLTQRRTGLSLKDLVPSDEATHSDGLTIHSK